MLRLEYIENVIATTIYRPKTTPDDHEILHNELETILKTKTSIICGNFNMPEINWNLLTSDNEGSRVLKAVKSYTCLSLC